MISLTSVGGRESVADDFVRLFALSRWSFHFNSARELDRTSYSEFMGAKTRNKTGKESKPV